MPLNIDINFRWMSQKPVGEQKENKKTSSSSCSSSSTSIKKKQEAEEFVHVMPLLEKQFENVSRRLIFIRHGERVDRVFPDWQHQTMIDGSYCRYNTNILRAIPERIGGISGFENDPPITVIGKMQAQLMGQALRLSEFQFGAIYCSPALRCVQTAAKIYAEISEIEGRAELPKIRIEPALFDWMSWYLDGPPLWMRNKELVDARFPVDTFYKPFVQFNQLLLNRLERKDSFYRRCDKVVKKILASTTDAVIIVTHATTIDAGARSVLKLPKCLPNTLVFDSLHDKYPYCCSVCLEQVLNPLQESQWRLGNSLPTITGLGYSTKANLQFLFRKT